MAIGCLHLIFQSIQNFPIYVALMPMICREHRERKTMIDSFRPGEDTGDIFERRVLKLSIIVADDRQRIL